MAAPRQLYWRIARKSFRIVRICVLVILAVIALGVLWFNMFGLPRWITTRIEAELAQQNLLVEIDGVHLRGFRDLVATGMRIHASIEKGQNAEITLPHAELLLEQAGPFEFSIRGIRVENGRVALPVQYAGAPSRFFVVSNITTELRFLPGDVWSFPEFSASALGMRAHATAALTNVSSLIAKSRSRPPSQKESDWRKALLDTMRFFEDLQFSATPELMLTFSGDSAHPDSTQLQLRVRAANVRAGDAAAERLQLLTSIRPDRDENLRGAFLLELGGMRFPSGGLKEAAVRGETQWTPGMQRLITNSLSIRLAGIESRWIQTKTAEARIASSQDTNGVPIRTSAEIKSTPLKLPNGATGSNLFTASISHSLPFPSPALFLSRFLPMTNAPAMSIVDAPGDSLAATWELATPQLAFGGALARDVRFTGELEKIETNLKGEETGPWRYLLPFRIPWQFTLSNIATDNFEMESLAASGEWSAPVFKVQTFQAGLYEGEFNASAALDVLRREAAGSLRSQFDYRRGALALDKAAKDWLASFTWDKPPLVESTFHVQLPGWNSEWNARRIAAGVALNGRVDAAGSFKTISVESVRSSFGLSNFVLTLPDIEIARPEGSVRAKYSGNITNLDFRIQVESTVDPGFLEPLFPEAGMAFRTVNFSEPPLLQGTAAGNWLRPESLHFRGSVSLTNLFIRGEPLPFLRAGLEYTNLVIEARDLFARRGPEEVRAPYLRIDIPREVMFVTNAVSTMNPWWAMSLVGEDTYDAIDPYRFEEVPLVKINGLVPLRHWKTADLHFNVAGTNFTYWRFHLPKLTGDVFWRADHISFSNVVAGFYKGSADWSGHFHINDQKSADFSFQSRFKNADLGGLVADLVSSTNQMQGTLDGTLVITSANSDDFRSWDGHGSARLTEGFLWNVPVFGVFSPIIDAIVPGESLSGVTAAVGTFSITNSVVHTRDLQVRAPAFRLNYTGQVDLDGNLQAVVEAEILRDAWFFGKVVSTVLWPVSKAFEAKVSGTVSQPKTTLRHFPKFMLAPLKVLGTLKEAVTGNESADAPPPSPAKKLPK